MTGSAAAEGRVVLLAIDSDSTRIVYHRLRAEFPLARVILERPISRAHLLKRRAQKIGKRSAASQAAFVGLMMPLLRVSARARSRELEAQLGGASAIPEAEISRVESANAQACIDLLRDLRPAVVVVNGTRILSQQLLTSVPAIFLNMHAGITPRYRGVHGGYWALAEGRPTSAGVTVHRVDAGIDTGGIVAQALVHPTERDSLVTVPLLQLGAGLPLLVDAVHHALAGTLEERPSLDASASRLHYHPGLLEYLRVWARRGVH